MAPDIVDSTWTIRLSALTSSRRRLAAGRQKYQMAHAIAAMIREANRCKENGEEKTILAALCGHGHFDLRSYESYLDGSMVDYEYPDEKVAAAMEDVPVLAS